MSAQVRVFVQTRGTARATDYAFLGGGPARPWWRTYRDATAFDHPTVLVTSDGERWAAYLSGIPSGRVDAVGSVVRYTLVLDGPCRAPDTACPMWPIWPGSPLPQFGVPSIRKLDALPTASHDRQNSYVMPVYVGFFRSRPRLPPLIS